MTQLSPPATRKVVSHWPWISGSAAVVLAVALGVLIALRPTAVGFDDLWMEGIIPRRVPILDTASFVLDFVGGGWFAVLVIPPLGALLLWWLRGRWTAVFFFVASAVSALIVHGLKIGFGRARPEDFLLVVGSPSFPSGHTANAATLAVVLGLIVGRWWFWTLGVLYTIAMAFSRTYLGVHWVTDTLGGVLIGAGVAFILWAPLAGRMKNEWIAEHPVEAVGQTIHHDVKTGESTPPEDVLKTE